MCLRNVRRAVRLTSVDESDSSGQRRGMAAVTVGRVHALLVVSLLTAFRHLLHRPTATTSSSLSPPPFVVHEYRTG